MTRIFIEMAADYAAAAVKQCEDRRRGINLKRLVSGEIAR